MQNRGLIFAIIGLLLLIGLIVTVWFVYFVPIGISPGINNQEPTSTPSTPTTPPTTTTQEGIPDSWNTFTNTNDGFAISYPPDFSLKSDNIFLNDQMATGTEIDYPTTYTNGTNLSQAYVGITKKTVTSTAACYAPVGYTTSTSQVTINGVNYQYSTESDAAAGNLYEDVRYATVKGDTCYNVALFMHSTQRMNYPPETRPAEFDRAAVTSVFDQIMKTFKIL